MSPCHSRAQAGVSQAWRWQHFHSFSGLVWGEWAITAGFGKGNGNTGGEAALGWGMGLACALAGDKNAQTRSAVAAGWESPRVHQGLRATPVPKTPRVWGSCWVLPGS